MERLNTFYYKLLYLFFLLFICNIQVLLSQGNCLIYEEDSGERIACELSYRALEYKQGSKMSQLLFDKAIEIGPNYAYAYYQKSVPFFKLGLLPEGISLISKAIELEPKNYLYYRAYWYYKHKSYEQCIKDLEELYIIHKAYNTTTPGGEMEMRLLLAISYQKIGNISKAISWVLNLMNTYNENPHAKGLYDHYCLGVLYYKNNQLYLAEVEFEKQITIDDDLANTYYYLGLIKDKQGNSSLANRYFKQALEKVNGINGGYSRSIFEESYVLKKEIVKRYKE